MTIPSTLSWPKSLVIAVLTGVAGMFAGGLVAAASVDWYNVSSREGESGYFVIIIALLSLVAGCVIGLVIARVVAAGTNPGFLKGLGRAVGAVVVIAGISGAAARLLADVPPEIQGEPLLLAVEVRWPADQQGSPATLPGQASLTLHSVPMFSHTVRASESGPLWKEDAHLVDGRWVAPGAVSIWTSRGSRMLVVSVDDTNPKASEAFLVPLPGRPGPRDLEWSDWLPRERPGTPATNRLTYRYRAQRISQTIRTETIGAWSIDTKASSFYSTQVDGKSTYGAAATFGIRLDGKPVPDAEEIALVAGSEPAFIVHSAEPTSAGSMYLLSTQHGVAAPQLIDSANGWIGGHLLTSDNDRFHAINHRMPVRGAIDRTTYDSPGLYLVGRGVVDTRTRAVHRFTPDTLASAIPSIAPLTLSPDGRSFVEFANDHYPSETQVLAVTNFVDNRTYTLPVDNRRMRWGKFDDLDPAWVAHHFEWKRGRDGADQLVERAHFNPLPYHGEISTESGYAYSYRLEKGSDSLRIALIDFLVADFKAQRLPADSGAYEYPVQIGDQVLHVGHGTGISYVIISMKEPGDTTLVPAIARAFNAALATGKYDSMFGP